MRDRWLVAGLMWSEWGHEKKSEEGRRNLTTPPPPPARGTLLTSPDVEWNLKSRVSSPKILRIKFASGGRSVIEWLRVLVLWWCGQRKSDYGIFRRKSGIVNLGNIFSWVGGTTISFLGWECGWRLIFWRFLKWRFWAKNEEKPCVFRVSMTKMRKY